ncbi:hypothetical protein [Paraburkholderia kirstenboschensis]|jgi:hypothetical protein|uniref:Uncharacterized protein n=1 Tax=Paraburkholderia kirstenboschensis TaxID=1245436 RepID=A0ABZ0EKF5_9BURK|nr:hypothetical protein [Paraburkholderia kirstenboschensis]WOD17075.1 hypothetical protein RW095_14680 [Paraburkholderia kirstenboschensis]
MLYEQSMLAAVRETILEFKALHGRDDLRTFAHAHLGRLEQRGKAAAGNGLREFIERGRLPEQTLSAPTRPVSTRKPVPKSGEVLNQGRLASVKRVMLRE